MPTLTQARRAEQAQRHAEGLERLRVMLADVETIYTVVQHVTRDGMSRVIMPLISFDGITDISWLVAWAGIAKRHPKWGGIVMGGCGMDMAFALVYEIGRAVIGNEPWQCRGDRCGSNEHVNPPRMPTGTELIHTGDGGYRFHKAAL